MFDSQPEDGPFKELLADAFGNLGNIYALCGEWQKSLDNSNRAIKMFEELKVEKGANDCRFDIATVYIDMGRDDNALLILKDLHSTYVRQNFDRGQAACLVELALIDNDQGKKEMAIANLNMAINLFKKENNDRGIADCQTNLGRIFSDKVYFHKNPLTVQQPLKLLTPALDLLNQAINTYAKLAANQHQSLRSGDHSAVCLVNRGTIYILLYPSRQY